MSVNTLELHRKVEKAIEEAERTTSAELRVHLEEKCSEDPLDRASYIFEKLEMNKTEARNGVLIYVAFEDRKLAIIGDVGIHMHVAPDTWETIKERMKSDFASGHYAEGLCNAVNMAGEQLRHYFPYQHDDRNELSNSVSTHPF